MLKKQCRHCGKEIDYTKFEVGKECPHCGEEMASVNIVVVHVAFDQDVYGQLGFQRYKDRAFELGVDYQKILLNYELCIGDISNPPYSNANVYAKMYSSAKSCERFISKQLDKLTAVPSDAEAYLWLESCDVNEYMNLCYFADYFKRFSKVHLVSPASGEERFSINSIFSDCPAEDLLVTDINLEECALSLKNDDVLKADYRIGKANRIVPCKYDWLKERVLKEVNDEYKNFSFIYKDVYDRIKFDTGDRIDFRVVEHVVNELVLEWRLQSKGAYMWWGDPAYNNMLCTQSFKLDYFDSLDYVEYETALMMVLQAFEEGFTYPLYDILDENAVLTFVDENRTICGKMAVIEFIENDGADRIHVNKQNVTCDILKVAEGERYGVGDKIILLTYERKNDTNQRYVIKVDYKESKVYKIELFHPYGPLHLVDDEEDLFLGK